MSLSCNSSPRISTAFPLLASTRIHAVVATRVDHCLTHLLPPVLALLVRNYVTVTHDEARESEDPTIRTSWNHYVATEDAVFTSFVQTTPLFRFAALGLAPDAKITLRHLLRRIEVMHTEEDRQGKELLDMPQTWQNTLSIPAPLRKRHEKLLNAFVETEEGITTAGCRVFPFLAMGNGDKQVVPREFHPKRFLPATTTLHEPFLAPVVVDDWQTKTLWCPLCIPDPGPPLLDLQRALPAPAAEARAVALPRQTRHSTLFVPIPQGLNPLHYGTAPWPPYPATFVVTRTDQGVFSEYYQNYFPKI